MYVCIYRHDFTLKTNCTLYACDYLCTMHVCAAFGNVFVMHVCAGSRLHLELRICVCMYMYVCLYACIYIYIYMYGHDFTLKANCMLYACDNLMHVCAAFGNVFVTHV